MNTSLTSITQTALDGMVVGNIFDTVNDLTSEAMIALKAVIVLFGVVVFLIGAVAAKGKTAGTIMAGSVLGSTNPVALEPEATPGLTAAPPVAPGPV